MRGFILNSKIDAHQAYIPLIPKAIGIKGHQNTGNARAPLSKIREIHCHLKNYNDSWQCPNCKKTSLFPKHIWARHSNEESTKSRCEINHTLTKGGGNFRVTFGRFGRLPSFA
ncbi:hypothetical protein AVEN_120996-1 [Araneus ventricosus]|uniref:Uncharacterized protein n=1 Tax=Araneus ventricosus TaxID=182803 RepID=A0A4Y2HFL1_ARAVE|nr:hypothetical protein AVEN_120996-1 [Araneus ventricosus]